MAIKPILVWRNTDSTLDLNAKTGHIIKRAIFTSVTGGGQVTPSTVNLNVSVQPFIAQGFDGLVVLNDAIINISLPVPPAGPPAVYYLALYAKYQLFVPSDVRLMFVPESTILTAVDKEFYVKFAKVTVAPATAVASAATWDFGAGEHSDSVGLSKWRDPVATLAALPVPPTYSGNPPNHNGDVRVALDTLIPYIWNNATAIWEPLGKFKDLISSLARRFELDRRINRSEVGTGISATGHNESGYADGRVFPSTLKIGADPLTGIQISSIPNGTNVTINPLHGYVNGHPFSTKSTAVNLGNAPVAPFRYDLVYLEVWRSVLLTPPAGFIYANNEAPNPPGDTYTFAELETLIEQIVNEEPYDLTSATQGNFDFNNIEVTDTGVVVVTQFRFSVKQDIIFTGPQSVDLATASIPVTISGFAGNYAAATWNARIGIASSVDPNIYQGTAYAIPIMVARRVNTEGGTFVPSLDINEFLLGVNIFDVAPITDSLASRKISRESALAAQTDLRVLSSVPTGYIKGYTSPITWTNGGDLGPLIYTIPGATLLLKLPNSTTISDILPDGFTIKVDASPVIAKDPPALINTGARDFTFLMYWVSGTFCNLPLNLVGTNLNVTNAFGPVQVAFKTNSRDGASELYAYGVYVTVSSQAEPEEIDLFGSLNALIGQIFLPVVNEPGVWATSTGLGLTFTSFFNDFGVDWLHAIPVFAAHRRNSLPYSITTPSQNFNGCSAGIILRPEEEFGGQQAHAYDLLDREFLDLRHATGNVDLDQILETSMDQMMRGVLKTRLQSSPSDDLVHGTSHLTIDEIGTVGAPYLTSDPVNAIVPATLLDGIRHSFSDAVETQVVTWFTDTVTVTPVAPYAYSSATAGAAGGSVIKPDAVSGIELTTGTAPVYELVAPSNTVLVLRIRAPKGSYIHSGIPESTITSLPKNYLGPLIIAELKIALQTFAYVASGTTVLSAFQDKFTRAVNAAGTDARTSYNFSHDDTSTAGPVVDRISVLAVDVNGRPTDLEIQWTNPFGPFMVEPSLAANGASIHVACMFVYDKPRSAHKLLADFPRYGNLVTERVTGLSLIPKEIYQVQGLLAGSSYNFNVGPIFKVISKVVVAATSVSITATDIGEAGATIFSLLDEPQVAGGGSVTVNKIRASVGLPTTSLTVEFSGPITGTIQFKVAYTSNMKRYWVELNQVSRGIDGVFTWFVDQQETLATGAYEVAYAYGAAKGPERFYSSSAMYPMTDPNKFSLGLRAVKDAFGDTGADRLVPFGWFLKAAGPDFYCTINSGYTGPDLAPAVSNFGRHPNLTSPTPTSLESTGYWDTFGSALDFGFGLTAGITQMSYVYAKPIALQATDFLRITYEGYSYQGVAGNNSTFATRLASLQNYALPEFIGSSLIFEKVSDLFITTAGTGLPTLDFRDFSGFSLFDNSIDDRSSFYDQKMVLKHGVSPLYRNLLTSSTRLVKDLPDTPNCNVFKQLINTYDLIMNFIPGPPNQFVSSAYVPGLSIYDYHDGSGPGLKSDYDHAAINSNFELDLIFGAVQNYDVSSSSLIRVGHEKSNSDVQAYVTAFSAQEANQIDTLNSFVQTNVARYPGLTIAIKDGYSLERVATGPSVSLMDARLAAWMAFEPEKIGRPGVAKGQGSQGFPTARPLSASLVEVIYAKQCEAFLQPCILDAVYEETTNTFTYITDSELIPNLLSQSSTPVVHQSVGNTSYYNQNLYYRQSASFGGSSFVDQPIAIQKLWAFKGSIINRAGICTLLVNSGFGANIVRDWDKPGVTTGTRPKTGFSADVFQLVYRPVKYPG